MSTRPARLPDASLSTVSTPTIATSKDVFDLLRDDLLAIEVESVSEAVSSVAAITEIAGLPTRRGREAYPPGASTAGGQESRVCGAQYVTPWCGG